MNILLVNDDGYKAEGISVLERVLKEAGHDVYVTAPSVEQSAKSHSMTILSSIYATEYEPGHFHISGSPADCIIYSLKSRLLSIVPDLVISGINHGYNLSSDILYSGTCAAARQACLYGYKAIAVSTYRNEKGGYDFEKVARFVASKLDAFLPKLDSNAFMNINVPPSFSGCYELSSIGEIDYDDQFTLERMEDGRTRITNSGCSIRYMEREKSTFPKDYEVCSRGNASISLVSILPTLSNSQMERFNEA